MTTRIEFTFSDLIAGYVTAFDFETEQFGLKTSDGRQYNVQLTSNTAAEFVRNLGEPYHDATGAMRDMPQPGRFLYAYGVFYPDGPDGEYRFDAKHIVFLGEKSSEFAFEKPDWWVKQIAELANFYLTAEFPDGKIDYANYRTNLSDLGTRQRSGRQEADTISRLVYGFASAFLLTGDDRYLDAAEAGTNYLRAHFRAKDRIENVTYWYHAVDLKADGGEQKDFASEFGDDYGAIPCYEQIYALAGPMQTYRITGDSEILAAVEGTIRFFNRFFKDSGPDGGYYSHLDPISLTASADSLAHNRERKNWNSIGDHAPAYLINLWLATGKPEHKEFLEYTFDTIALRFPDYEHSPFVQEKFFADWSKDQKWRWQQNRAVVGHNLKIAWNLTRMHALKAKPAYENLARRIAELMPAAGGDPQRGGWYDVVERQLNPNEKFHRFAWRDRKAWWQQEQAILAYLILGGVFGDDIYRKYARESAAFYNAWFLDVEMGGVYFNVLANGHPYELGTERGKGSHSMAGYHSFELAYLAATYTNLLLIKEPLDLFFRPKAGGFPDGVLRVSPDILPQGSVRIDEVWIDGVLHHDFDAAALTVKLPPGVDGAKVQVRLVPAPAKFAASLDRLEKRIAGISLSGELAPEALRYLEETVDRALAAGAVGLDFEVGELKTISGSALRYLLLLKQRLGGDFSLTFSGAGAEIAERLADFELTDEAGVS